MIHSERMPQASGSTTHSATAVEVAKCMLPIGSGEVVGERLFTGKPSFGYYLCHVRMIAHVVSSSMWVAFIVQFSALSEFFRIGAVAFLGISIYLVSVSILPFLNASIALLFMIIPISLYAFLASVWVTFEIPPFYRINLIWVVGSPTLISVLGTLLTSGSKTRLAGWVFVKFITRFFLLTLGAVFNRGIHSASLSLISEGVSAGGEIFRFSGISLADIQIISQGHKTCSYR